jgi:glycosyltransferase involved in cell wall biosynthesis
VVTTNHGPFDETLEPIYAEMSHRGVAIVAISAHQASTAPDVRIAAVIHHGIDVADVPVGSGEGGYACFLGRMVPDKGVREAVLAARAADMPLRIAAKMREPAEEEYFEEEVRPLLGGDISYIGELDHDDKYGLLGNAVALLNPLQWPEPFGLVMIEALACGTPIVACPNGSVPEIVRDGITGFLRDDTSALAEALHQVATLSRAACRESAASSFSTARMVADHIQLYEQLLSGRAAGSTKQPEH